MPLKMHSAEGYDRVPHSAQVIAGPQHLIHVAVDTYQVCLQQLRTTCAVPLNGKEN